MNHRKQFYRTTVSGLIFFSLTLFLFLSPGSALSGKKQPAKDQRDEIRSMTAQTLIKLYTLQPKAKEVINQAAGYGVFSNFGLKSMAAGSSNGYGLVINNVTKQETFMKMRHLPAGSGGNSGKFRAVFVFANKEALDHFIESGWDAEEATSAQIPKGDKEDLFTGAFSLSPGIWIYPLTDQGPAPEAALKGIKCFKDDKLNTGL
jgi:hypothetical protein